MSEFELEETGELRYGDIVVIDKDGLPTKKFPFFGKALIGRTENCDIRVNLPYVSRKHAFVSVDENGQVILQNLCKKASMTMLNHEPVHKNEILENGDVFTVADRRFQWICSDFYLQPDDECISSKPSKKNKMKNNENVSSNNNANKEDAILRENTSIVNCGQEKSAYRPALPTPVRAAIRDKTKSTKKKALPTPLRKEIAKRSTAAPSPHRQQQRSSKSLPTPLRHAIGRRLEHMDAKQVQQQKGLPTPVRKEIQSKRSKELSTRKALPTPIRRGIQARKMEDEQEDEEILVGQSSTPCTPVRQSGKTSVAGSSTRATVDSSDMAADDDDSELCDDSRFTVAENVAFAGLPKSARKFFLTKRLETPKSVKEDVITGVTSKRRELESLLVEFGLDPANYSDWTEEELEQRVRDLFSADDMIRAEDMYWDEEDEDLQEGFEEEEEMLASEETPRSAARERLSTPVRFGFKGTRTEFSSPSSEADYDEYHVHWTYSDYEGNDSELDRTGANSTVSLEDGTDYQDDILHEEQDDGQVAVLAAQLSETSIQEGSSFASSPVVGKLRVEDPQDSEEEEEEESDSQEEVDDEEELADVAVAQEDELPEPSELLKNLSISEPSDETEKKVAILENLVSDQQEQESQDNADMESDESEQQEEEDLTEQDRKESKDDEEEEDENVGSEDASGNVDMEGQEREENPESGDACVNIDVEDEDNEVEEDNKSISELKDKEEEEEQDLAAVDSPQPVLESRRKSTRRASMAANAKLATPAKTPKASAKTPAKTPSLKTKTPMRAKTPAKRSPATEETLGDAQEVEEFLYSHKVAELRQILKQLSMDYKGKKAELVERLQSHLLTLPMEERLGAVSLEEDSVHDEEEDLDDMAPSPSNFVDKAQAESVTGEGQDEEEQELLVQEETPSPTATKEKKTILIPRAMKVAELRDALLSREIEPKGRKADLIALLEDAIINEEREYPDFSQEGEQFLKDGHEHLWQPVTKEIGGVPCDAVVVGFLPETSEDPYELFRIRFLDGDVEDLEKDELESAMALYEETH